MLVPSAISWRCRIPSAKLPHNPPWLLVVDWRKATGPLAPGRFILSSTECRPSRHQSFISSPPTHTASALDVAVHLSSIARTSGPRRASALPATRHDSWKTTRCSWDHLAKDGDICRHRLTSPFGNCMGIRVDNFGHKMGLALRGPAATPDAHSISRCSNAVAGAPAQVCSSRSTLKLSILRSTLFLRADFKILGLNPYRSFPTFRRPWPHAHNLES